MTDALARTGLFAVAALTFAGCGDSKPATHTVSGTVTVGAKPLEFGVIRFSPDGSPGGPQAANVKDGTYTAANLQPGKYKVTIEAMAAVPVADGTISSDTKPKATAPPVTVPEKYRTGVPVEITGNNPALNFDLSK